MILAFIKSLVLWVSAGVVAGAILHWILHVINFHQFKMLMISWPALGVVVIFVIWLQIKISP